jgi:hypothetical protein
VHSVFEAETTDQAVSSTLSRGYGTLAGLGFIGAAMFAVPSTLLLDPAPPSEDYLATVAGLVTGLVCMALPWERLDLRWLHAVGVVATIQAAVAVAVFGQPYTAFFFLIAVGVAYMAPDVKGMGAHLGVIGVALFGPVIYGPADSTSTVQIGLVVFPLLALTAGVVAYLRQRMVADHRSYRLFAEETLALAQRISGSPLPAIERKPSEEVGLPAWSRLRVSARASGLAACILALPLLSAGLAAAGVRLPTFASGALGEIGIDLPNQDPTDDDAAAATTETSGHASADGAGAGHHGAGGPDAGGEREYESVAPGAEDSYLEGTAPEGDPSAGGDPDPGQDSPSPPDPAEPADGGGSGGGGSLGDSLQDAVDGLGSLLGGQRQAPEDPPSEPSPGEGSAEG